MFALTGRALRRVAHVATIVAIGLVVVATSNVVAQAETRTLKLYHVHLREKSEVTYKRNGRFIPDGLKAANWALRDWRESKPTDMDPHLLDMLWEIQNRSGTRDYINIIGGYRSPNTNKMLRSRSSGVADNSQHTKGKAIDFFIPDVPLSRVRSIALQLQLGGVGYYPRSGSPFVHIDTGNGRYWPRMNRNELAKIFPNGKTIYVPADGKPLPGYETAMASYNQRRSGASVQMADARRGGPTLLARLFGGGSDEAEDNIEADIAPAPARRPSAPAAPARQAPQPPVQVAAVQPTPRASLPVGVPMPDRDSFDTSARRPVPGAEIPQAGSAPQAPVERQVAALAVARVPVPTSAPARAATIPAGGGADDAAVEPVQPIESTLMAALEASRPEPAAPGQLAYAVPMPSQRPAFEAILEASETPVPAEASQIAAIQPESEAVPAIETLIEETTVAALLPDGEPALASEGVVADPVPAETHSALVAALNEAPAMPDAEDVEAVESPSGKSGRVLREAARPASATPVRAQEAIAKRIEVASLVTSPERRALESKPNRPRADMLVVDVPVSVLANGFAPSRENSASDRFSGSAVNFLPVRKFNER